jgi:hypothetical protein
VPVAWPASATAVTVPVLLEAAALTGGAAGSESLAHWQSKPESGAAAPPAAIPLLLVVHCQWQYHRDSGC